jgi:hypothetical protein
MISTTTLRTDLTESATELDRVLALVETTGSHAQEMRASFVEMGVHDIPLMLDDLQERLDDATQRLESARETLASCADAVRRMAGTGEERARTPESPDSAPAPATAETPSKGPAPSRGFDWSLVRMLISFSGVLFVVAAGIFDAWLQLVSIIAMVPSVGAGTLLSAGSIGLLDRYRTVPFFEVVVAQVSGVLFACGSIVAAAVGRHELTGVHAAAVVVVLVVNTAVGIVILRRYRAAPSIARLQPSSAR